MSDVRPLVFVDLDDTLFQTARKMPANSARHTATLDASGNPNGFMTPVQKQFTDWLLSSADVVPVTARSTEVFQRVSIPFNQGAVCSHGGVMLDAEGKMDQAWRCRMESLLGPLQEWLHELSRLTLEAGQNMGLSLRGWVVEEQGLGQYVVTKHNQMQDSVLLDLLAEVRGKGLLDDMHIHANGNNLAFLPLGLEKKQAVLEWLRRDAGINGERPVMGFGDSLTDLGFMQECHFWATPAASQLAGAVQDTEYD